MPVTDLSKNLKAFRGERSQTAFALFLGISQNTYNRYEHGGRVPKADILSRMAQRLGTTVEKLLGATYPTQAEVPQAKPIRVADAPVPEPASCGACVEKDRTIATQAESIANLTRSISKLVEKVR